jgi:PAS domain S-box-containing protein
VAIAKISKDDELVFQYANSFYGLLVGRKPEDIIGKPLLEALPEIKGQGFDDLLKEVIRTAKPFIAKEVAADIFREEKIETIYVNLAYQPRTNSGGVMDGVLVVATDVTEQVRSRKVIEESEAKYRTLFESMDQGYCTLEIIFEGGQCVDYRYLETNPTFERHLGMSNALGKTIREIAPDIEQKWFDFYGGVALTGKAIRIEEESKAFNKWFQVYAIRIGDPEERKVGVFFTDVTERKRAEEVLRESEARFRSIIEQAPVAIALTNGPDLIFESINLPMLQIINRNKEDVVGKKLAEVLPELKSQPVYDILLHVLQTGESFMGIEVAANLVKEGISQRRYFNISYTRIVEISGANSVLHMSVDVTEEVLARRKIEESETKLRSILNSAPTAMGVFVGPDLIVENPNQFLIEVLAAGPRIEGKSFRELLAGLVEEDQKFIELIDDVRTTGQPFEAHEVCVFFKTEKKARYFNISFIPLRDESGEVYAVLDVSVDVTQQFEARQALEEKEAALEAALEQVRLSKEAAELGTFDMDLEKGDMHWDQRCRTLFGISHNHAVSFDLIL